MPYSPNSSRQLVKAVGNKTACYWHYLDKKIYVPAVFIDEYGAGTCLECDEEFQAVYRKVVHRDFNNMPTPDK